MPQSKLYKFSPSNIKDFICYVDEVGYEKEGELIPFVNEEKLLQRLNKYPTPSNEGAQKGIDFENSVFGKTPIFENVFDEELLTKVRSHLPKRYITQLWVEANLKELYTIVGGYCDVVGGGKIQDIKTGHSYSFPEYNNSPQLLYMVALKDEGIDRMEFIHTNYSDVFKEDYSLYNFNFSTIYEYIERLKNYVDAHESEIVNLKIFGREDEMPWMSESEFNSLLKRSVGTDEDKDYVKNEMVKRRMKTVYRNFLTQNLF